MFLSSLFALMAGKTDMFYRDENYLCMYGIPYILKGILILTYILPLCPMKICILLDWSCFYEKGKS